MTARYACVPIPLDPNHIYYISQRQLVKANEESIRLGFSRNLVGDLIAQLSANLKFPILSACKHTSGKGMKTIRLFVLIGSDAENLNPCFLDVTPETWAEIKKNFRQRAIEEGK
jgi:hypothetical protein